ncbi:MAG: diguanylate cyclase [Cyanobacteria bacterium J06632_3]
MMPKNQFLAIRLQKLLLGFFALVAVIPILFLGTWAYNNALAAEIQAVEEKHLLLAENVSGRLSSYGNELKAIFGVKAEGEIEPIPEKIEMLLQSVNIQMLVIAGDGNTGDNGRSNGAIHYCMGDASFLPEDGIDGLLAEKRKAFAKPGEVIVSPLVLNAKALPTMYLLKVRARDQKLAIAAVSTKYFHKVQKQIVFGDNGHAAIVDSEGHAIAHPDSSWQATAKDISQLEPIRLMQAYKNKEPDGSEKGVAVFYSPAMKADMIAAYTAVPNLNWGVMIPQPYSEIEARAGETRNAVLFFSALGLLLAIGISWRLTDYILGPVNSLIEAAQSLERGDRIAGLAIKRRMAPREIHHLINAFDHMAHEVSQVRDHLETQVAERTQALLSEVERRKQLEQQLIKQATHDALTGLPNRRLLTSRLTSALALASRHRQIIALFFLDLDGFKQVNDTYGHQVGDKLLVQVAARLQSNLRTGDSVFRLGGDEFVILVEQLDSMSVIDQLSNKILGTLTQPFYIGGQPIEVGGSIGVKTTHWTRPESAEEILADADSAMYEAKTQGNCAIIFDAIAR